MIIDRFPLTGTAAYLIGSASNVDLVAGATGSAPAGVSQAIGEHRVLDIDSIDLLFTASDLTALLARQSAPIVEVRIRKEMFPKLVTDPYARRVHTAGGPEDFRRGTLANCRVMDIEGRATLVSETGGPAVWKSPRYNFGERMVIAELAWEMGITRLGPAQAFRYHLSLLVWDGPPGSASTTITIAADADVGANRAHVLNPSVTASSAQFVFVARIGREAAISERHAAEASNGLLGVPLLQAVHLLERRTSQMVFHSLHELNIAAKEFTLYGAGDTALTSGIARINLRAALTGADAVEVWLGPGVFSSFEARLSASIIDRPPTLHR